MHRVQVPAGREMELLVKPALAGIDNVLASVEKVQYTLELHDVHNCIQEGRG
jgi:hypothetical protein